MSLVYSSFSHDLLTPLKCVVQLSKSVLAKLSDKNIHRSVKTIVQTASLLFAQAKSQLD